MKRVVAFFLVVIMAFAICAGCVAEDEEEPERELTEEELEQQYREHLVEWEKKCYKLLEECGLRTEDAVLDNSRQFNAGPKQLRWKPDTGDFLLWIQVPDYNLQYTWKFDPEEAKHIWYKVCRNSERIRNEAHVGIDQVEDLLMSKVHDADTSRSVDIFNYASDYEMEHMELKPMGSWPEFRERFNQFAMKSEKRSKGYFTTNFNIPETAVSFAEGQKTDAMLFEFDDGYSMKVWLEHGTENICRIVLYTPVQVCINDNQRFQVKKVSDAVTFQENTRMHLLACAAVALKDEDLAAAITNELGTYYWDSNQGYQENEMDGFLFRTLWDYYDETYQQFRNDMRNNVKYNKKDIQQVKRPMTVLIQGN